MEALRQRIEELWERVGELSPKDTEAGETVTEAVDLLDRGLVRVAETASDGTTMVHEWLKKAILLL
ncbi:MAG: 2,3,4,5-tetrahydropyridine-2,6-dicarboxylate N-succinyltransferase, partial [Acidimicrobiales bacterium]